MDSFDDLRWFVPLESLDHLKKFEFFRFSIQSQIFNFEIRSKPEKLQYERFQILGKNYKIILSGITYLVCHTHGPSFHL